MVAIILLIIYLFLVPYIPICDGDTFFHLTAGQYIFEKGFPQMDPFSIHDISYFPHEWLSDVCFHVIYRLSGFTGLFLLQYIYIAVLLFILYKFNCLVTGNKKYIAFFGSIVVTLILSIYYITIRPQIFTYLIIILEIYTIEVFIRNRNKRVLIMLPLLSLALANFHSGVYPLFFILIMPYLVDTGLKIKWGRVQSWGLTGNIEVFFTLLKYFFVSLPIGLINPYGIRKLTYFMIIFKSEVAYNISEWLSPDFDTIFGLVIFISLLVSIFIFVLSHRTFSLKAFLMLCGLGYMSVSAVRYFPYYLLIAGGIIIEYICFRINGEQWRSIEQRIRVLLNRKLLIIPLCLSLVFAIGSKTLNNQWKITDFSAFPVGAVEYLKNNTDYTRIRIYNEYYHGGYLIFNGIKVFVDPRGDLYVQEYNPGCTVLNEYRKVMYGITYYEDIFYKYNLQYALVFKDRIVDTMLKHSNQYICIYCDDKFMLYKRDDSRER